MKNHNGMRPHDIAVLLKIATKRKQKWFMKDLANELFISASEISESLNRSAIAGLVSPNKKSLNTKELIEFLEHGIAYVFPVRPGAKVKGFSTACTAPPLSHKIKSISFYVWPDRKGDNRGESVKPLYPKLPKACLKDPQFYELATICDTLRMGNTKYKDLALRELKNILH